MVFWLNLAIVSTECVTCKHAGTQDFRNSTIVNNEAMPHFCMQKCIK